MTKFESDEVVLLAIKTPLMARATTTLLPGNLSVSESLVRLRKSAPKDADVRRVIQQLEREMAGTHDCLSVNGTGEAVKIDPATTTLRQIAVPREVRTAKGVEEMPTAALEVQAYAPVG